jgi:O-antigen ligase
MVIFVSWVGLQSFWALNPQMHKELLVMLLKYTLLIALVYKSIDSIVHLKIFLWTHAAGCFYLGTVVISDYLGGRFEGFSGPGINEANAAALLIVTGVITTFVIFLTGKAVEKVIAVGFMPFTLNALVATISRSGFLALAVAGLIFNFFVPKQSVRVVRIFSVAGLVLLVMISNPLYWERIGTILIAGEDVSGVDTGSGRLVLIQSQFEMFSDYPMGCGHRCTAVLSPTYMDDVYLTGKEGNRARSSHNTYMTLLVEQGLPGAIFYVLLLIWIARTTFRLRGRMRNSTGLVPTAYAATVSILAAITVGDLFVDYLKFEARFWFIGMLMVLAKMDANGELIKVQQPEQIKRGHKQVQP